MNGQIRDISKPGWLWMPNEVLDVYGPRIGPTAVAVYAALCRFADNDTQECYPSRRTLAKLLSISVPTVSKELKRLASEGLVAVVPRFGNGGMQTSNRYTLLAVREAPMVESLDTPPSIQSDTPARDEIFPRTRPTELDPLNYIQEDAVASSCANPLATPAESGEKPETRKRQQENAASKALEDEFVRLTRIAAPSGASRNSSQARVRWWLPLRNMLEQCEWNTVDAPVILQQVIIDMRQRKLQVSAPQSAEKMFTAACGLRHLARTQKPVVSSTEKPWWAEMGSMRGPVQTQHSGRDDW